MNGHACIAAIFNKEVRTATALPFFVVAKWQDHCAHCGGTRMPHESEEATALQLRRVVVLAAYSVPRTPYPPTDPPLSLDLPFWQKTQQCFRARNPFGCSRLW